jgi:damage-control phosphatase, subfamily I
VKAAPDCIPCILRQVLNTARKVTDDDWLHRKVLNEIMQHLAKTDFDRSPAELVSEAIRMAHRPLGSTNPFADDKKTHTASALALEARLREAIDKSADPLHTALKLAGAANVLDANIFGPVELQGGLDQALATGFKVDDYIDFQRDLAVAKNVLIIGDSAGETVADKLLIERLISPGRTLTYAVRKAPILNDATREDAEAVGVPTIATVIDTGSETMGAPLSLCSQDFRTRFEQADLVLAKGAANYETLDAEAKTKYFLLHVKCIVVARHFGVAIGDAVFIRV